MCSHWWCHCNTSTYLWFLFFQLFLFVHFLDSSINFDFFEKYFTYLSALIICLNIWYCSHFLYPKKRSEGVEAVTDGELNDGKYELFDRMNYLVKEEIKDLVLNSKCGEVLFLACLFQKKRWAIVIARSLSFSCKNINLALYSKSIKGNNTKHGILAHHDHEVQLQDKGHNSERYGLGDAPL